MRWPRVTCKSRVQLSSNRNGEAPNDVEVSRSFNVHSPSIRTSYTVTVPDSPLPSTVEAVTSDFSQIRILVLGKAGCGKSSLINTIFGVEIADDSHDCPGKADLYTGLLHSSNNRLILHDSQGFDPGDDEKFDKLKRFIEERTQSEMPLKDKLHLLWICISVPTANERVIETGLVEVFKIAQERKLPTIIIFTKYDKLVTPAMSVSVDHLDKEQLWQYGENKASEAFEKLCVRPWREAVGKVPLMVSIRPRYKNTLQALIQATDAEIRRQTGITSRTDPRSFNFAAAQRLNADIKIDASIDIGRLKYWSGLLSNTDFLGKGLLQCLDVIHRDIISIWNIRNSSYLASDEFKAKMIVLIDDLAISPNTSTSDDGLAVTTVAALSGTLSSPPGVVISFLEPGVQTGKWVFEVYKNNPHDIACITAYIIDLTILMHRFLGIEISEESIVSILQDYAKSEEIAKVHNDIRMFSNRILRSRLGDKDYTLNEILRLVEDHRIQVPQA